jgi:sulfonate transport system permease protein
MSHLSTPSDPGALVPAASRVVCRAPARLGVARRALGPLLVVALWVALTLAGLIDPSIVPSPAKVAKGFVKLWTEQNLVGQVAISLERALLGGAIGMAFGLMVGIAAGLTRLGEELFDALLQMLRTVPFLALVPLFIVWFGIGEVPKLLLIALATCFPM